MADENLYMLIDRAAEQAGERPVMLLPDRSISYAQMRQTVARLAARLVRLGGQPGDRLLAQVEKSPEAVLLYLACLSSGLVYVPLNTAYTAAELDYFISDAQPRFVVCDPSRTASLDPVCRQHGIPSLLTLDKDGRSGTLVDALADETPQTTIVLRSADDLAAILYTSGTTGRSKGAMLSHGNLASNALTLHELWRWEPGDVLLHALPVYHVHGLFVASHGALLNGSTMLFHAHFDAGAILADLPRASVFMGVPTFYTRLLDQPGLGRETCAGMRLFLCGSAPLLESTFAAFAARTGHTILERYGMTEAGMITSNPYDGDRVPGTVGYALPDVEVRIRADDGSLAATDAPGVLEVRGPNLFRGYWRNPQKTAEDMRADGFFITGDIATMAADGRVRIVGRAKDLIISGGFNIYPKEIELLLDAQPGVGESAVIGVPHPDFGEAVVAVIVPDGASTPDVDAIMASLTDQIARFKQPKKLIILDALPRNAMGKVQKAALRTRYAGLFA